MDASLIIKRAITRIPLLFAWFLFLALAGAGRQPEGNLERGEERSTNVAVLLGSSKGEPVIGIRHPCAFNFAVLPVCDLNLGLLWPLEAYYQHTR